MPRQPPHHDLLLLIIPEKVNCQAILIVLRRPFAKVEIEEGALCAVTTQIIFLHEN
jgi:hypothetical protein